MTRLRSNKNKTLIKSNIGTTNGLKHWGSGGCATLVHAARFGTADTDAAPTTPTFQTVNRCEQF